MTDNVNFEIIEIDDHRLQITTKDPRGSDFCWKTSRTLLYTNMLEIATALNNRTPSIGVSFTIG